MGRDRRRYPRVGVALDIVVEALGIEWQVKTVDLSPYGVKVTVPRNSVALPAGTNAELKLGLPDGNPPLVFRATVIRTDPDGVALNFEGFRTEHFERLRALVDSLLKTLREGPQRSDLGIRPVKERRRAPRVEAKLDINFSAQRPPYWSGKTVDLSPYGVKVALPSSVAQPEWGSSVELRLAAVNGQAPISLKGVVWRKEPDNTALLFVEFGPEELKRVQAIINALQA